MPSNMDETLIDASREIADELSASLPEAFDIGSVSARSKLPLKALTLRESLVHRASELADTALDLIDSGQFMSATIIVRALMETTGVLCWLHQRTEMVVTSGQLGDIDDFLMNGMLGERLGDSEDRIPALSAVSAIKRVDRVGEFPVPFFTMYERLCEFAHPNWSGVMGAYSKVDYESWRVSFGRRHEPEAWGFLASPLYRSLVVFRDRYNDMARFLPDFIALCEDDADAAGA